MSAMSYRNKMAYVLGGVVIAVAALAAVIIITSSTAGAKDAGGDATTTTATVPDLDPAHPLAQITADLQSMGLGVNRAEADGDTLYLGLAAPTYDRSPDSLLQETLKFNAVLEAVRRQADAFGILDLTVAVEGQPEPYYLSQRIEPLRSATHLDSEQAAADVEAWMQEVVPAAVSVAETDPADATNPQTELSVTHAFDGFRVDAVASGGVDAVARACELILAGASSAFDKGMADMVVVTGIVDESVVFVGVYDGRLQSTTQAYVAQGFEVFF